MKCDNDSSMGHTIISPQCYKGEATKKVVVQYNEVGKDTLDLCDKCAKNVAADARRHGYKVTITK